MKPNPTPKEAAQTATPIRLDAVDMMIIDDMIRRIRPMLGFARCEVIPARIELHNKFNRFIGFIEGGAQSPYQFVPANGVIPYTTQS